MTTIISSDEKKKGWKDISKRILQNAAIGLATQVLSEKVVPAVAEYSKEVWSKVRKKKNVAPSEAEETVVDAKMADEVIAKPAFRPAKLKISKQTSVVDAEFRDKKRNK